MTDQSWLTLARFTGPAGRLAAILADNSGCRIGESTVVSKKLHLYHAPQELSIIRTLDAGMLLYSRSTANQIIHLDVFHQCGLVDHHRIAGALKDAVAAYLQAAGGRNVAGQAAMDANLIDIQTATGGGRITGALRYGLKPTLQKAHQNHVHVAALLPDSSLAGVFFLVSAIENVILHCGLELRCLEKLTVIQNTGNQYIDLSEYTDHTDSLLKQQTIAAAMQPLCQTDSAGRLTSAAGCPESSAAGVSEPKKSTGDSQKQILLGLESRQVRTQHQAKWHSNQTPNQTWRPVPGIEQHIRKLLQTGSRHSHPKAGSMISPAATRLDKAGSSLAPAALLAPCLDITATVHSAARKLNPEQTAFTISPADLRFKSERFRRQYDFCIILDASASMEGLRLQTAKAIIARLLGAFTCRISLIVFQDQSARLKLPFTGSRDKLNTALNLVQPYGATPLALGLKTALDYLKTARARQPLFILITDGGQKPAPAGPLADALAAAREIKAGNYPFTCIGLAPEQYYLSDLAALAGGTVYPIHGSAKN